MTGHALKLFFGLITVQVVITGFVLHTDGMAAKIAEPVSAILVAIAVFGLVFLALQRIRRHEAVATLKNICDALQLYEPNRYLCGRPINAKPLVSGLVLIWVWFAALFVTILGTTSASVWILHSVATKSMPLNEKPVGQFGAGQERGTLAAPSSGFLDIAVKVSQVVGAFAMVAVVVLAIWGDRFKRLLAGPRLRLSLRPDIGDMVPLVTATSNAPAGVAFSSHLRVVNRHPRSPARSVKVKCEGLAVMDPQSGRFVQPTVFPVQMNWVYPAVSEQSLTISFGDEVCALGMLSSDRTGFRLSLVAYPTRMHATVGPAETVRYQLRAYGEDCQSNPCIVEITWDGEWADSAADLCTHLQIREVNHLTRVDKIA
jgi:hypothetical protein